MACTLSEDSDQPAFAQSDQSLRCPHEESLGPLLTIECTAKADLSFRWVHSHFVGSVMRWLNYELKPIKTYEMTDVWSGSMLIAHICLSETLDHYSIFSDIMKHTTKNFKNISTEGDVKPIRKEGHGHQNILCVKSVCQIWPHYISLGKKKPKKTEAHQPQCSPECTAWKAIFSQNTVNVACKKN